ncbi:MAG: carbohydrate kinase family protein [bacterium]|nr:carbohydrate kinase family protein [bacterium]
MKHDIITIGGAVEDITFCVREGQVIDNKSDILRQQLLAFEYGAKIVVNEAEFNFGGGASNVAVSASRLGLKTAAIACVGNGQRAQKIIEHFQEEGVDTAYIQYDKLKISGFSVSLVLYPDNEHTIFTFRGANDSLIISSAVLKKLETNFVYVCSLSGDWRGNLKKIFHPGQNFKIAWNPGSVQLHEGSALVRKYLEHTHTIIMNQDEATELVVNDRKIMSRRKHNATFLNNIKNLLRVISSYGPKIVVITRGRSGADAYDGKNFYHSNIIDSKRLDTTGVGDAFGSSFISGLILYDGNIKKAIGLGIRNTASVISKRGAQNGLIKL